MVQPYVEYLEHQIQPMLGLKLRQNYVCIVWKNEEWKKKEPGKDDIMWKGVKIMGD